MTRLNSVQKNNLRQDFFFIGTSIVLAVWLTHSGTLERFLSLTQNIKFLESFAGGMLFTSVFTTAPAIALLAQIAQSNSVLWTAFFGALGALFGDLILFKFIKDRFSEDLKVLVGKPLRKKLKHLVQLKLFRWFLPFVGALIIASPLPDELGIALLGFAKTRPLFFVLFSFTANFVGIWIIGTAAQLID